MFRKRVEPETVLHARRNARIRKHRIVLLHDVADLQALLRRQRRRVNAVQRRHHALQLLPVFLQVRQKGTKRAAACERMPRKCAHFLDGRLSIRANGGQIVVHEERVAVKAVAGHHVLVHLDHVEHDGHQDVDALVPADGAHVKNEFADGVLREHHFDDAEIGGHGDGDALQLQKEKRHNEHDDGHEERQ
ncbi:MAG: hypothetical protein EBU84_07550 [Actinobacteria bacterium]|nr:hypothetical protein [Actinomycetota bacterium]